MKIRERIAAGDDVTATQLAQYGRPLTLAEVAVNSYMELKGLDSYLELECSKIPPNSDNLRHMLLRELRTRMNSKRIGLLTKVAEKKLCRIFAKCVKEGNTKTIHEIASAIECAKQLKPTLDVARNRLLNLKQTLIRANQSATIHQISEIILWNEAGRDAGLPHLRRLVKQIGVPTCQAKPGRKIVRK